MRVRFVALGLAVTAIIGSQAGCLPGREPMPNTSTPAVVASVAPSTTPVVDEMNAAEKAYLERLRKEQPEVYLGCDGQESEKSVKDIRPNLEVIGLVWFQSRSTNEYPHGIVRQPYSGTKIDVVDFENGRVKVTWANQVIDPYMFIRRGPNIVPGWHGSLQHHRGGFNEAEINPNNLEGMANVFSLAYEVWYVLGLNPDPVAKCKGKDFQLYRDIRWDLLFVESYLDSDFNFGTK